MAAEKVALFVALCLVGIFRSAQGFRATYTPSKPGGDQAGCDFACDSSVGPTPACDSFGNQYPSKCQLERFLCLYKKAYGIDLLYEVPCELQGFGPSAAEEVVPTTQRPNWLDRFCSIVDPVCDTFGNMYPNHCKFHEAQKKSPFLKLSDKKPEDGSCECAVEKVPVPEQPDIQPGEPICEMPCVKPKGSFDGVCDQYGFFHLTPCFFENVKCHLSILRIEPCPGTKPHDLVIDPVDPIDPAEICELPCESPMEPFGQFCDQHGNYYYAPCFFENAKCKDSSLIKAPCPVIQPGDFVIDPVDPIDPAEQFTCEQPCGATQKTVCDQNGESYRNPCEFENAKCKNPSLRKAQCLEILALPDSQDSTPSRTCKKSCKGKTDFVCDHKGGFHLNPCHFQNAKCSKPKLKRVPCPPFDPANLLPPPPKPKMKPCSKTGCYPDEDPVCDQYGNKYMNACELSKFQECYHTDSKLAPCPPKHLKPRDPPPGAEAQAPQNRGCTKMLCMMKDVGPVCDQFGKVYKNHCALFDARQCGEDVRETPCPWDPSEPLKLPQAGAEAPARVCSKVGCIPEENDGPVCDQFGKLYKNRCGLFYEQECGEDVTETPCPPPPPAKGCFLVGCLTEKNNGPVCDQFGRIYKNHCELFYERQCGADVKETPCPWDPSEPLKLPAACEVKCGTKRRIVCDQYANSYRNPCEFENARCQDPNLQKRPCPAKPKKRKTKHHKKCDLLTFLKKFYQTFIKGTKIEQP